ncbi:hypothetical protein ACFQLX_08820 [Streptomyces polyrhachis]|uniref:Integral membrane protein n=1 Tax=Streptomyces polyrhachis TaxID=1282885 RepID=A0ABW2GEV9_9ACTN
MFALRLARGAQPLATVRRLLVAVASAGVGFLLLTALGHASAGQLLWCAVPMLAAVWFAVAVARSDPRSRPPAPGLDAAGFGPAYASVLAAVSTLVSCLLGSAVALLVYLHLRGEIAGLPFDGAAARLLGAGPARYTPLPLAAALTLLIVLPLLAALASAYSLRPDRKAPPARPADGPLPLELPAPAGLPWGAALAASGLALGTYGSGLGASAAALTLPGGAGRVPPALLGGWVMIALGLVLAGPGVAHLAGRVLGSLRPGPVRLLAGRTLQQESRVIGHPLGALTAVVAAALVVLRLRAADGGADLGPIAATGAWLVVACTVATVLLTAGEASRERAGSAAALRRLGASAATLGGAAALRAAALQVAGQPLAVVVARVAPLA